MAIQVSSFMVPKNGNLWYILEDKFIKGGLHVVATAQERDEIPDSNRKAGMLVIVQADGKVWSLAADLLAWNEFKVGGATGVRTTLQKTVTGVAAQERADFSLSMGGTALVYSLAMDSPCQVEVFETSERSDENPFRFVATDDHLRDDGSSKMTDGTILRGRRYHIFANQDAVPTADIHFRITNLDARPVSGDVPVRDFTLTITFLPVEGALQPVVSAP